MRKRILLIIVASVMILILISAIAYHYKRDALSGKAHSDKKNEVSSAPAKRLKNQNKKNISQKPSGPADLKSIPTAQLEEPKAGAGEILLDKNNNPVIDSNGKPILK